MKAHQRTVGKTDTWLTPPQILAPLGRFDLDPCAAAKAPRRVSCIATVNMAAPALDGLACEWNSESMKQATQSRFPRVWCNPPFNRYERPKWMRKMSEHGNGIMLIPAATETAAFFNYVWERAHAVCFLRGRPHFHDAQGVRAKANCGCSIVLVAYGWDNAVQLFNSNLGKTIRLKSE